MTRIDNRTQIDKTTTTMQCYKKIWIENKATGDYMEVNCNKCNFCLQNRRQEWAFRMYQEQKISMNSAFVTLTYDQENVPRIKGNMFEYTLKKKDLYRFLKSLKQNQRRHLKKTYWPAFADEWKIRYFAVGEYGTKFKRPHYHLIIFNIHPDTVDEIAQGKIWNKGLVHVGQVTIASASYCAKYVIDKEPVTDENKQKPFCTMSRNPGIGYNYIEQNGAWHREKDEYYPDNFRLYVMHEGYKKRLPRYYKNKIFVAHKPEFEQLLKDALEIHYEDIARAVEQEKELELIRLEKLHPNPQLYYEERRKHHHDNIRVKSLSLNKL